MRFIAAWLSLIRGRVNYNQSDGLMVLFQFGYIWTLNWHAFSTRGLKNIQNPMIQFSIEMVNAADTNSHRFSLNLVSQYERREASLSHNQPEHDWPALYLRLASADPTCYGVEHWTEMPPNIYFMVEDYGDYDYYDYYDYNSDYGYYDEASNLTDYSYEAPDTYTGARYEIIWELDAEGLPVRLTSHDCL